MNEMITDDDKKKIYESLNKALKEVFGAGMNYYFATHNKTKREITDVRLMSMKVIHDECLLNYKDIGDMFGKTKSNVRGNVINASNYIDVDYTFRTNYKKLKEAFRLVYEEKGKQNR